MEWEFERNNGDRIEVTPGSGKEDSHETNPSELRNQYEQVKFGCRPKR